MATRGIAPALDSAKARHHEHHTPQKSPDHPRWAARDGRVALGQSGFGEEARGGPRDRPQEEEPLQRGGCLAPLPYPAHHTDSCPGAGSGVSAPVAAAVAGRPAGSSEPAKRSASAGIAAYAAMAAARSRCRTWPSNAGRAATCSPPSTGPPAEGIGARCSLCCHQAYNNQAGFDR